LASGTAATARFNAVVTLVNLIAIFYIVLAAAPLAEASNLKPFAPEGMRGDRGRGCAGERGSGGLLFLFL
jgi:amino acid transporter